MQNVQNQARGLFIHHFRAVGARTDVAVEAALIAPIAQIDLQRFQRPAVYDGKVSVGEERERRVHGGLFKRKLVVGTGSAGVRGRLRLDGCEALVFPALRDDLWHIPGETGGDQEVVLCSKKEHAVVGLNVRRHGTRQG